MTNERLLSDDEQKAKEHVEFYYFWLFHYCARNYEKELRHKLPQAIPKPLTSNKKLNPPSGGMPPIKFSKFKPSGAFLLCLPDGGHTT